MIQTENSRADSDMDAVKLQIKMIDESKNILSLGGTIFSDMLKEKEIIFTEIKPKLNLGLVEYIEKLSNENSWDKELPNLDKKYDIIILNEILGQVSEPRILLQRMSAILSDNGSIIAHIKNSSYLTNTWKTLGGIFKPDDDEKNNFHSFDLGSLLSFLNDANFAVSELNRIEKKIQWVPNYAPDYNFPYSLLQVLKKDPESEVFSYVFRIEMKNPTGNKTGIWTSKIGKNYFLESLKDKIEYYESSIKPIKNQEKIIDELETSIKEMNNHIDLISASRDVVINRLEDSVKKSKNEFELINTAKDVVKKELDESKEKIQNAFLKYYKNKSGTKLPDNLIRKGLVEEILHGYHVPSASQEWLSTLTLAEKERLIVGLEFILADYKRLRDALIQSKVYRLTKKFTR